MNIHTISGTQIAVPTNDESNVHRSIGGEDYVELIYHKAIFEEVPRFSKIEHNGDFFYLLDEYRPRKNGGAWRYQMRFVSLQQILFSPLFVRGFEYESETIYEADFEINANLWQIAQIAVDAINLKLTAPLTFTFQPETDNDAIEAMKATDLKRLSFSGMSIGEALNYIAQEFETEWWLSVSGNNTQSSGNIGATMVLHLNKCHRTDGGSLLLDTNMSNFGKIYVKPFELTKNNETPGRVYIYGGTKNMPHTTVANQSYRHRLRLPNGQEYIDVPGGRKGLEAVKLFDEIFPETTCSVGTVTWRGTVDFPIYKIQTMSEDGLTVQNIPDIAPGEGLRVHFQSGYLQGREFACNKVNATDFEIVPDQTDNVILPFPPIVPVTGNEFVFLNVLLDSNMIEAAQQRLLDKATEYTDNLAKNIPEIRLESMEGQWRNLGVWLYTGRPVQISDYQFYPDSMLNTRVRELSYPLFQPFRVSFTCAEGLSNGGKMSGLENMINDQMTAINSAEQTARAISRTGWRSAAELSQMLDSITAEMALIGIEDNAFINTSAFQANRWNNFQNVFISQGQLMHAVYPKPDGMGLWIMQEYNDAIAGGDVESDTEIPFYIYAVCSQQLTNGEGNGIYYLSPNRLDVLGEDYSALFPNSSPVYCFLCGVLSSVIDNRRVLNITSGYTLIAGGSITTEKIQDANENLVIDLSANPPKITAQNGATIEGAIKFKSGTTGIQDSTDINGGLIATNIIGIKDNSNNIVGGICGKSDYFLLGTEVENPNNIAQWFGGNFNNAVAGLAKILFRKDGTGLMAGGNFKWDTGGNITLEGIINALGGNLGAFSIVENRIEYHEGNINRISLSYQDVTTLNQLTNQGTWERISNGNSEINNLQLPTDGSIYTNVVTGQFTINNPRTVKISVDERSVGHIQGFVNGINQYVEIELSGITIQLKNSNNQTQNPIPPTPSHNNSIYENIYALQPGTYTILINQNLNIPLYQGPPIGQYPDYFMVTIQQLNLEYNVFQQQINPIIELAKTGINLFFDQNNYFHFSQDYGLEIKIGSVGFKISSAGIQKWMTNVTPPQWGQFG